MSAGALVKTDEQEVINFLLTTEIIPLCLRIMESGSELSKTVFFRVPPTTASTDEERADEGDLVPFKRLQMCILGRDLHPPEDSPGRHGPGVHLSDL